MLVFTPLTSLGAHHPSSPRDRYISALADASFAEAEYLASLRREQEDRARLRQQREEALRRELLLQQLYALDADTPCAYPSSNRYHHADPFAAHYERAAQEQQRRRALLAREQARRTKEQQDIQQMLSSLFGTRQGLQDALYARITAAGQCNPRAQVPTQNKQHTQKVQPPPTSEAPAGPTDFQQFLNLLSGGQAHTPGQQSSEKTAQPPQSPSGSQSKPVAGPSAPVPTPTSHSPHQSRAAELKERLAGRLQSESEVDVRDAVQSLLSSLFDHVSVPSPTNVPTPTPSSTSATTPTPVSIPVSGPTTQSESQAKGKGKERVPTSGEDSETETESLSPSDIASALAAIRDVEAALDVLRSDFTFPSSLDFEYAEEPKLAYTSQNAPLRYYEHSLGALQTRLDAVRSGGAEEIRAARRDAVGKVEETLEEIEREIKGRWTVWKAKQEKKEEKREEVEAETFSSPEDTTVVPAPVEAAPEEALAASGTSEKVLSVPEQPTSTLPANEAVTAEEPASVTSSPPTITTEEALLCASDSDVSGLPDLTVDSTLVEVDLKENAPSPDSSALSEQLPTEDTMVEAVPVNEQSTVEMEATVTRLEPASAVSVAAVPIITLGGVDASSTITNESRPESLSDLAEEEAIVDTFLLPASPVIPPGPVAVFDGEDGVIVGGGDEEHSDWSEVEA